MLGLAPAGNPILRPTENALGIDATSFFVDLMARAHLF